MLSNQIDGFLVSYSKETTEFSHFSKLLDQGYPIVFFDRVPEIQNAIHVIVDDYAGAYEATKHYELNKHEDYSSLLDLFAHLRWRFHPDTLR